MKKQRKSSLGLLFLRKISFSPFLRSSRLYTPVSTLRIVKNLQMKGEYFVKPEVFTNKLFSCRIGEQVNSKREKSEEEKR